MSTIPKLFALGNRVRIVYTNWRGVTTVREIIPIKLYLGSTEYHPKKQWLLKAYDTYKKEHRHFSMKDIKRWDE